MDQETFDFGTAIKLLKEGKCLCRQGWNGKNMFICKQVPCVLSDKNIIDNMQSLPREAKDVIIKRPEGQIAYTNQCLIVNSNGRADSWVCSISDMFAEDWMVYQGV